MTPTSRSMAYLRDNGWVVDKAEHWNPFARKRKDLFGFADLVALAPGMLLAVQVTTRANMGARRKKIAGLKEAADWRSAGGRILLHGWYRKGRKWELKSEEL